MQEMPLPYSSLVLGYRNFDGISFCLGLFSGNEVGDVSPYLVPGVCGLG